MEVLLLVVFTLTAFCEETVTKFVKILPQP